MHASTSSKFKVPRAVAHAQKIAGGEKVVRPRPGRPGRLRRPWLPGVHVAEKWALNSANQGLSTAKPRCSLAAYTVRVNPPTSPCPTLSAFQSTLLEMTYEAENLMTPYEDMGQESVKELVCVHGLVTRTAQKI